MRRHLGFVLGCLLVVGAGCAATTDAPPVEEVWPAPPPESELARVRSGMSQQEVMDVLGPPSRITNRSGVVPPPTSGETRTYYVYPGLGEVVFSAAAGGATSALGVYYAPRPQNP